MKKSALVWFKNDLRIRDNNSLKQSILENDTVIGVFFFDPRLFQQTKYGFKKTEKYRAKFLVETLQNLKENLDSLNISLLVFYAKPEDKLPEIIHQYNINQVYLQKEWTTEEYEIQEKLHKNENLQHIRWVDTFDQFLYHPNDIPFDIKSIPRVFTNFRKGCEKSSFVRKEVCIPKLASQNKITHHTMIPSLRDLGFEDFEIDHRSAFPFNGGEDSALERINNYFWESKKLSYYKKTRNGLVGSGYSSKLSAWLANGSISPRTIYWQVKKYEKEIGKNDSTYWLVFELIWRDFFKYISLQYRNRIFGIGGILQKKYSWSTNEKLINQWIHGETPEPFVNANMIELKETGWMSNRGRQNVASFFAKEWQLDWRIGAAYFESMLIDYDVHSNYGNWMYVSGVGNDPRDRKFNIKLQAERYDNDHKFQKLWLQTTLF